jgi:hypothetical protein
MAGINSIHINYYKQIYYTNVVILYVNGMFRQTFEKCSL